MEIEPLQREMEIKTIAWKLSSGGRTLSHWEESIEE
jgi:hypothetical protein